MMIKKWARLLLAVAPVLAGCKGFWDVPSGSGGSGGSGTASGFFYVLNQKTAQVAGFSFAANSTTLTAVTNSPYTLAAAPVSVAMSPNGGFLYVSTAAGIFVYSVNASTGQLTLQNNQQVISADAAFAMAVDPSGGWLVESIPGLAAINAIPLDSTTGVLLSGASEQSVNLPAGAATVQGIAFTGSGATNRYVFAAMGTTGTAVIPFTSSTSGNPFGAVKTIAPKNSTGGDTAVAVDLTNPVLYVGETVAFTNTTSNPGGVRMFTIGANSALTEVTGSPFASGGVGPSAILPTTHYIYVANKAVTGSNNGNITAFGITTTGGTATGLTAVTSGTISAGVSTLGLAEDSSGTYILAVNSSGSPDLNAFTIGTTGALTSYATASTGTDPVQAVAIAAIP
jgi:6-phosphogluconolactonase (cycloisomerase 2 family)